MERWVEIMNGRYAISDHGRVKNADGRLLKPATGKIGYPRVMLYADGVQHTLFIHRAVAHSFIGQQQAGMVVDHIDGSRDNNHFTNLQYLTHAENVRKGYIGKTGDNHHSSKICDAVVAEIKRRRLAGERGCDLAREFGVSQQTICDIVKGRSRKESTNVA